MRKIKNIKHVTLILLGIACCFFICACSKNKQNLDINESSETCQYNTGNSLYDDTLNKIATAIDNGEDVETDEYSYMYGRFGKFNNSNFGYALIDVNSDGNKELVVGETGTAEYPCILYDMYMMDGKKMVHVFSGGERDRYYATDIPNAFYEEGSSSAEDSFYEIYVVEKGKLQSANFVAPPKKVNLMMERFKTSEQVQAENIEETCEADDMFIPYSFLEERTGKNFFESKEEIINNLKAGEGYAFAKMKNGEEVVLISEKCYSSAGEEYVSMNAVPYYKTGNGYAYGNTPFGSGENDYPIKVTNDGDIICAGSHLVEKYELIINDNRRGFGYKYTISEETDESSSSYYSGFVTDFETETTTSFDEENDGSDFYIKAVEEYSAADPIIFAVISE